MSDFNRVVGAADQAVEKLKNDIANNVIVWKEFLTPKPKAMRAFEGRGGPAGDST